MQTSKIFYRPVRQQRNLGQVLVMWLFLWMGRCGSWKSCVIVSVASSAVAFFRHQCSGRARRRPDQCWKGARWLSAPEPLSLSSPLTPNVFWLGRSPISWTIIALWTFSLLCQLQLFIGCSVPTCLPINIFFLLLLLSHFGLSSPLSCSSLGVGLAWSGRSISQSLASAHSQALQPLVPAGVGNLPGWDSPGDNPGALAAWADKLLGDSHLH